LLNHGISEFIKISLQRAHNALIWANWKDWHA
jgi:hypothetical protein